MNQQKSNFQGMSIRTKPVHQSRKLKFLALHAILALTFILGAGYVTVLEGKTVLGQKMQDWIWEDQISSITTTKADFSASITYADSGTFKFIPSKIAKKYDKTISRDELASLDQKFGFTWKNLYLKTTTSGFFNMDNTDNPKVDAHIGGQVMNNNKNYKAGADVKIINKMLFTKYEYNDNVLNLLRQADDQFNDPNKNEWIKETDQQQIQSFIDGLKEMLAFQNPNSNNVSGNIALTDKQKQVLKKNRLLNIKSFKGIEIVNGQPLLHYSLELNKPKLRSIILENFAETLDSNSFAITFD